MTTLAFTLIELLAIIVILAIIAVITVPIILGVIDNAKRGSIIDSAYGYKDAIDKFYFTKLSEDASFEFNDRTYLVSELKGMGFVVSGNEPTDDSWVVIKDNEVYDFSLKFDDYVANYDVDTNEVTAIKNGTIELTPEAQAEQDRINNVKQIITAYIEEAKTTNSDLESETVKSVSDMTDVVIENGPVEGWIHFDVTDDGEVVIKDYSLKVDNYIADYSEDITVTKNGTLRDMPFVAVVARTIDGVKYYDSTWIGANPVYFDPTGINPNCTKTDYDNNIDKLGKTGCMKWYAYSEQNGDVNLLLDHNTTATIPWVTKEDYDKPYDAEDGAQSLGVTYLNGITGEDLYGSYGNWNKGPITLLKQLKADTDSWGGVPSRTDGYTASNNYNSETVIDRYTIDYSGYKARLISGQEIANIENETGFSEKTQGYLVLTSLQWLHSNATSSSGGYWTSSPWATQSYYVFHVDPSGYAYRNTISGGHYYYGLRPVITVSKSKLSLN